MKGKFVRCADAQAQALEIKAWTAEQLDLPPK